MNPSPEKKPIGVKALELNHELMGCEQIQTKKFTFKAEMDDTADYSKQSTSASKEPEEEEECKLPEGFKKPKRSEASTNLSNLLNG